MAEETTIIGRAFGFGRRLFDEAVVHATIETLKEAVTQGTKSTLRRLKVRLFGWGDNDERISLGDQAELGHAAVTELNKFLEGLDDYWTYRLRIIVSGIEDKQERLKIYRMILDESPEERKRQLEQVCQTPEYLTKAAKWIWERAKAAVSDKELREDALKLAGELDRELEKRNLKRVFMKALRRYIKKAVRVVDDAAGRAARKLRRYNNERERRRRQPLGFGWGIVHFFTGYDRRMR